MQDLSSPRLIARIHLQNVGRIESETIEFGMLTRVEGENGAGKSMSIFDSLDIACNGGTFGEDMVREGAKFASIKVDFTDGSSIERQRDRNKQKCIMTEADGTEHIRDTIKDIVEEIQKFTGFTEVALINDKEKESFQFVSIDAPQTYMLGGSAYASNLRKLSKVVGGTGAETAKAKLESEVRNLNKERDVNVRMLQDIDKRFSEVWSQIDIQHMQELFQAIEHQEFRYLESQGKIERVNSLLDNEDRALEWLEQLAGVYEQNAVDKAFDLLKRQGPIMQEAKDKIIRVCRLAEERKKLRQEIPQVPDLVSVQGAYDDYWKLYEKREDVTNLLKEEEQLLGILETYAKQLADVDAEIALAKAEEAKQRATAPSCKECGRPMVVAA